MVAYLSHLWLFVVPAHTQASCSLPERFLVWRSASGISQQWDGRAARGIPVVSLGHLFNTDRV